MKWISERDRYTLMGMIFQYIRNKLKIQYFLMQSSRCMQYKCTKTPQMQLRKLYQRAYIENYLAQYTYTYVTKYISLTQEKIQTDLIYADYPFPSAQNRIIRSYILDDDLAIVWQGDYLRNLQKELQEKQHHLQRTEQQCSTQKQRNKENCHQLSYLKGIYELPVVKLPIIPYIKYPAYHDFVIGRNNFVRSNQSHKIASDSISKQHCEIMNFNSNSIQVEQYIKTMKKILLKKTGISSKIKKIPDDLWNNIFQYIKPRDKYMLMDLGSRNGTWVCQVDKQIHKIQQNFEYQFEKQSYSLYIIKMFTSKDTQNQSILQHNQKAHTMIEQFKKQVNWNYYQRANKIMLLQDAESIGWKDDQKMQVLIFKIKYRDYHEYYLLAVNESCQKKHTVGCKFDIDINPEEYDTPSLHGRIYINEGRWMIETFQLKRNGEYRKIWTKIVKDYKYYLNTEKEYKIRLGNSFYFSLGFHNFGKKIQT